MGMKDFKFLLLGLSLFFFIFVLPVVAIKKMKK